MESPDSYVASLDIGTTTVRCIILNRLGQIAGSASSTVQLIYPKPGFVEISPNHLWDQILNVINAAVSDAKLNITNIKCLGIATQRSTFLTWCRDSGKPFHNFITWKDIRAKKLCKQLNSSLYIKALRVGAYGIYFVTRSSRFLTGSRLKISSNHVTGRLLWVLQNIPELKAAVSQKTVMFGTIDTWLLYKFSKGNLHVTDISNAAATGFYDPFVSEWGSWATLLGIPEQILPQVVENDFDFGNTAEDIFGVSIPIRCVMADQSSSMFASCCFATDDVKITLGTGAFLDVNTSTKIHTSVTGIYPLVGWKLKGRSTCIGEVPCNDCGSLIQWLLNIGLINNPSEIGDMVTSIDDSDGVYFIPAFSGLGPPINDEKASSGFLGIKPTTTPNHMVRSVLEGIIYRIVLAFQTLKNERNKEYDKLVVDGGVSKCDFVCQMLADLTGAVVERLQFSEMTALGVGFLAGLSSGIWKDYGELKTLNQIEKSFKPTNNFDVRQKYSTDFKIWLNAVDRFKIWYEED
ncbi:hypothetical protein Zmor_000900 [Zophobas morio]|uniref:Glycerol kinase 5 n=1 Tax=Zophobas morio TaxID=2755281 RepID=A0AA38J258_9CUCU|nr:hypothetical protein Zmor_000900 [Zophobas morio]